MSDGAVSCRWDSDPGLLEAGKFHHVTLNVDGGPKMITFAIDGRLCDGGGDAARPFGTGRFWPATDPKTKQAGPQIGQVEGAAPLRLAAKMRGEVREFRLHHRHLRTSEAIANYRATLQR